MNPRESLNAKLSSNIPEKRIWLTREEAAIYLGVSKRRLDVLATEKYNELPFSRAGKRAMYNLADLENYLLSGMKGKSILG